MHDLKTKANQHDLKVSYQVQQYVYA